jgi:hypothetical protein
MQEVSQQVHIAGPTITFDDVRRQRCAWCGALIDEVDLSTVSRPLDPGETPEDAADWEPASWRMGDEVAVMGTFPRTSWLVETPIRDGRPRTHEDSCTRIDLEITR